MRSARCLPSEALVRSAEDPRSYRVLWLHNKLRCVLISDSRADKAAAAACVAAGHFSDPSTLPGLAHFTEHMCFLGTTKYPEEGSYKSFLTVHGGSCNASTAMETTTYHFALAHEHLDGALDRFAQFFIAPLFTPSATLRELNAVNAEHSKNLQTDARRIFQLIKSTSNPLHPFFKFGTGHLGSLRDGPHALGIDSRAAVIEFFNRHYTAGNMSLAVLGRQSLDDLERMILDKFSDVRPQISEADAAAIKYLDPVVEADKVPDPYPQSNLGRLFHVVPVNDIRSLRLFFPLPPVKDHYRSLPTRILSHQLGHEAAGSILALLKERGWATNLSAGVDYSTQTFASFGVTVTLSELGLQHCSDIVALVFRYIELMRNQSDSQIEEARSELAAVAESTFQFKGIEESSSYVTALSKSLHDYAPEHVLSGDRLWFESRTDLTRQFLNSLRADNCNIFVVAKSSPADRTEHWFGTPYSESTIPESWMQVMQHGECCPQLHLPKRNPFIATDFSIVVPKQVLSDAPLYQRIESVVDKSISVRDDAKLFDAPAKVFENDRMCVWHKPDDRFSKPKCTVVVKLWTSAMQHEPMSQLCSQLLLKMIDDSLDDIAYDASLASLHSSIDDLDFALKFSFSGFSHKLPELLHEVFARFMSLQLQPERLIPLKERLGCALRNFSKQQPQEHAGYFRQLLLSASSYHLEEKLALLDSINVEQLEVHRRSLLQQAHMDCFAYGNIEAPAALKLFQKLDAQVRSTSAPLGLRPTHWARMHNEQRTVQLPERSTVYHRVTHTNVDDKNSATSTSWQVGPNSRDLRVRMQLLSRMLRAPIFAQLRTREQLGYLVSSGLNIQHGVLHFVVTVQSDHQSADYLQQRIDACVHACRESVLLKTTPSEWETNRASLVQSLLETPKTPAAEASDIWTELGNRRGDFTRAVDDARAVAALNLPHDIISFFDEFIANEGRSRRRLSSQVFASRWTIPAQVGADKFEGALGDVVLVAPPTESGAVVHVDNIGRFKSEAPLYPWLGHL